MFGLGFLSRRPSRKVERSCRLGIEVLEDRACPSTYLSLFSQVQSGHVLQVSGSAYGDEIAGVNVSFSGAASGSATTNSNGQFTYSTNQATLGTLAAVGTTPSSQSTNTVYTTVTCMFPTISMSLSYGTQRNVTVSGTLTSIDAAGRNITLTGVLSGTAVTDSTGHFSYTGAASALGAIDATTTDLWGQSSNTAEVVCVSNAPTIDTFTAYTNYANLWFFQGHVTDENACGLTISFGGLTQLAGQTAVVQADGTFSFSIQLPANITGTATAITTDWWGQNSNEAWFVIA